MNENKQIDDLVASGLQMMGIDPSNLDWTTQLVLIAGVLVVSYIVTKVFKHFLIPAVQKITAKTKATWDDYIFNERMLTSFCRMIPPIMYYILLPFVLDNSPTLLSFLMKACQIYLIITTLQAISTFLNSLYEISNEHENLRNRPLKGIYQMLKLIAACIGIIIIISILIDKDATIIIAGLGASATVLMLIFKDSILGLVAGVQLSANDMLRPGDWITMTKYGADGYVIEVSLTTVKVQNFDKTITTIPPYALVSDSFQNWRGMRDCGSRRIRRAIYIDMTTVHFCTEAERKAFIRKGWLEKDIAEGEPAPVNLQVFRSYVLKYIEQHPNLNHDMLQMVRQLAPTTEGLPIEIYCFTNTPDWIPYEGIQSEIFDHLLSVVPEFGLRIFQRPTGSDLKNEKLINS